MQDLERVRKHARDLRREEPRSPAESLAGYPLAARCVDKCRATLLGWQGDFMFNCPMDQQFFSNAQLNAEEFKTFVGTGASDEEVEHWIERHARRKAA